MIERTTPSMQSAARKMETQTIELSSGSEMPSYGPHGVETVTGVAGRRASDSSTRSCTSRSELVTKVRRSESLLRIFVCSARTSGVCVRSVVVDGSVAIRTRSSAQDGKPEFSGR